MQCESAAHQRSGKPGSTVPVGIRDRPRTRGPCGSGEAPPCTLCAVLLEVDAPLLVGDELARRRRAAARGCRRADRRQRAVVGDEHARVDVDLALLQVPVGPHLALARPPPCRRLAHVQAAGRPSISHSCGIHGPTATTTCSTSIGPAEVCTRVDRARAVELEAGDLDALLDLRARRARLGREAEHRLAVVGEAARALVQADAEARGAPVAEQRAHVAPRPRPRRG